VDALNEEITYLNTQDGLEQFLAMSLTTVRHFGDNVKWYELINEPNNCQKNPHDV
jgi:hypothetical protein